MAIDKVNGTAFDNIANLNGVAKSSIGKLNGQDAPSGGSGIITTNLIQHLDAGDSSSYSGSGTTWADISGQGVDATLYNSPTHSTTEGGGSFSFDGVNDYALFDNSIVGPIRPSESELNSDGFTVQMWIKQDVGDVAFCWTNALGTNNIYHGLVVVYDNRTTSGGRIVFHKMDGDGGSGSASRRSRVYTNTGNISGWKFITWRFDSASNSDFIGFVNSTKFTSGSNSGFGSSVAYGTGRDGSLAGRAFNTSGARYEDIEIAVVLCYDVALTDQQVTDNFDATKSRFGY